MLSWLLYSTFRKTVILQMTKVFKPTHSEGCQIAAKYLHKKMNCGAVFIEPNPSLNTEAPDAIGFRHGGCSILMEVKVNRGDFLSDKKKPHRMEPSTGMGDYRFYVCPEGLIRPEELPPKWGLFYFTARQSLKPVHVPDIQITSLSSPQHYRDWILRSRGSRPETPRHLVPYEEMLDQFAHFEKNHIGEMNIMYGAWRQLCIAQERSVPYTVNEVFQRPEI